MQLIRQALPTGKYKNYIVEHDLLYKTSETAKLLVIPKGMQTEIIQRAHEVGHFGIKKTENLIADKYWINKLREKIEIYIQNCIPCILGSKKEGKSEGFLNPIPKEDLPL